MRGTARQTPFWRHTGMLQTHTSVTFCYNVIKKGTSWAHCQAVPQPYSIQIKCREAVILKGARIFAVMSNIIRRLKNKLKTKGTKAGRLGRSRAEESRLEWWWSNTIFTETYKRSTWSSVTEEARIWRAPADSQTTTNTLILSAPITHCMSNHILPLSCLHIDPSYLFRDPLQSKEDPLVWKSDQESRVLCTVSKVTQSMEPPSESSTFTTCSHPAAWELSPVLVLSKQRYPSLSGERTDGICHLEHDKGGGISTAMLAYLWDIFESTKTDLRRGRWDVGCL